MWSLYGPYVVPMWSLKESFSAVLTAPDIAQGGPPLTGVFIRAPGISQVRASNPTLQPSSTLPSTLPSSPTPFHHLALLPHSTVPLDRPTPTPNH